jgi:hypothetical protein
MSASGIGFLSAGPDPLSTRFDLAVERNPDTRGSGAAVSVNSMQTAGLQQDISGADSAA